jgi:cation:H+ antiporter
MAILLALDLASPGSSIFATVSPLHAISGLFAVALMALGLAAIVYRAERRFRMIEPDSIVMVMVYVGAVAVLYGEATQR